VNRTFFVSLRMAAATIVAFGMIYPLLVWGISAVAFPRQAAGSLVESDGRVVGSRLIGQSFTSREYFHGRPSAAGPDGYDAMASGASNLGPTNAKLVSVVEARVAETVRENPGAEAGRIPVDLVTASASGLDPDISPAAAYLQVRRVATARRIPEPRVRSLVAAHVQGRDLGFLGEPRVNVLELNLALDELSSK